MLVEKRRYTGPGFVGNFWSGRWPWKQFDEVMNELENMDVSKMEVHEMATKEDVQALRKEIEELKDMLSAKLGEGQ